MYGHWYASGPTYLPTSLIDTKLSLSSLLSSILRSRTQRSTTVGHFFSQSIMANRLSVETLICIEHSFCESIHQSNMVTETIVD